MNHGRFVAEPNRQCTVLYCTVHTQHTGERLKQSLQRPGQAVRAPGG